MPGGTNIYRVRYDGTQMQMIENVSETTGLGLGVHVTVNPKNAQSYFVTDGQKDIAACFEITTSKVKAALRFDWAPNVLRTCATPGSGAARHVHRRSIPTRRPASTTARHQGNKIDWELVPMGELVRREARCPAERRLSFTSADGTIWHPKAVGPPPPLRPAAASAFSTPEKNFEPAAFLEFNKILAGPIARSSRSTRTRGRSSSTRSTPRA